MESVHNDFNDIWENYAVHEGNPKFGERLLQAVIHYNSNHL